MINLFIITLLFISTAVSFGDTLALNSTTIEEFDIYEKVIDKSSKYDGLTVSYADILENATSSVVAVYTSKYTSQSSPSNIPNGLPDLFRQFGFPVPEIYGQGNAQTQSREELMPYGVGSGVILSSSGHVITNHHVVHDRRGNSVDEIKVRFSDNREFLAELVGTDKKTDVAVLKINTDTAITPISVANSDHIRVGDVVFAIGNPLEIGITATQGIISGTGRQSLGILGQGAYENFIQTDASINLGNSGGALVDAYGRLIGINTAIFSKSGGSIGIGFAIPINLVLDVMKKLVEVGEVPRGMLGIYPENINLDLAEAFGLNSNKGALVNEVQEGSPADRAGIIHGDIIIKVGDRDINTAQELRLNISQMTPGTKVAIELYRKGKLIKIPVILGSIDDQFRGSSSEEFLDGVIINFLNEERRSSLSVPDSISGVIVTKVMKDSPFSRVLKANMIILEVNGKKIKKPKEINNLLTDKKANHLYVWYNGKIKYLVLKI